MIPALLPMIVEPEELEELLDNEDLAIIDLSRAPIYARHHVPGALHLEYALIVTSKPPIMGLLPDAPTISKTLASLGLTPDTHIVAYDDEGGAKACRFLWTLDAIGHKKISLLNGGLQAWINENHKTSNTIEEATPSEYPVTINKDCIADKNYILDHLNDPSVILLDARTTGEYEGTDKRALRGGHIPGAVNLEWTRVIDQQHNLRLKDENEIRALYLPLDIMPDKEIITYCQTHHRSAHSYVVLKSLGYQKIRAYPGAWSEWGNNPELPVE